MFTRKALALIAVVLCLLSVANANVVDLDSKNFDKVIKNPAKNVFVMFYAPWCGHCNHMKPAWQELGEKFDEEGETIIARIDASAHRDVAKAHGIQGFPTMKLFTKGNKKGIDYQGPRQESAFQSFIKSNI